LWIFRLEHHMEAREFSNNVWAHIKTPIALVAGLLIGVSGGFAAGYRAVNSQSKHDAVIVENYGYFVKCMAKIPRHRGPLAKQTEKDLTAARNRAFDLLAAEDDCGARSGNGGFYRGEIVDDSGYTPATPLARKLFPLTINF
jgi:hypothetical protein